jgi:hypothetical protein
MLAVRVKSGASDVAVLKSHRTLRKELGGPFQYLERLLHHLRADAITR